MFNKTRNHLIEAKAHATRSDVWMAIGQFSDYGRFTPDAYRAILLPEKKPDDDLLVLLASQASTRYGRDGPRFHDTACGEFTARRRGSRTWSVRGYSTALGLTTELLRELRCSSIRRGMGCV